MGGAYGVENSVKTIDAVAELAVDSIDLFKSGISLGKLQKILEIVQDITGLAGAAPAALPELLELDAADAAKLGEASYRAVKKIVDKLKA